MSELVFVSNIEKDENVIATYFLESKTSLEKAA